MNDSASASDSRRDGSRAMLVAAAAVPAAWILFLVAVALRWI